MLSDQSSDSVQKTVSSPRMFLLWPCCCSTRLGSDLISLIWGEPIRKHSVIWLKVLGFYLISQHHNNQSRLVFNSIIGVWNTSPAPTESPYRCGFTVSGLKEESCLGDITCSGRFHWSDKKTFSLCLLAWFPLAKSAASLWCVSISH